MPDPEYALEQRRRGGHPTTPPGRGRGRPRAATGPQPGGEALAPWRSTNRLHQGNRCASPATNPAFGGARGHRPVRAFWATSVLGRREQIAESVARARNRGALFSIAPAGRVCGAYLAAQVIGFVGFGGVIERDDHPVRRELSAKVHSG
jgi:hypothetical protein